MRKLFLEVGCSVKSEQDKYGKDLLYISRLYSRFIENVEITDLRKIAISIIDPRENEYTIPPHKLIKVCAIFKYFDWYNYSLESQVIKRYKIILDFISENVLLAAQTFNWPKQPFEDAYLSVIASEFKNEFTIVFPKQSKSRKYSASVIAKGNVEWITVILCLEDNANAIKKEIEVLKLIYYVDQFERVIDKIQWINDDELIISNNNREINFKFFVDANTFEVVFIPKKHTIQYLQEELKLVQYVSN